MVEVEAVGEELGEGGGGDDDAGRQRGQLDEVEGGEEGLAERGGEAVVGRREDADEVDLRLGLGDGDGAARMLVAAGDGDCEERVAAGAGGGRHDGMWWLPRAGSCRSSENQGRWCLRCESEYVLAANVSEWFGRRGVDARSSGIPM